MKPNEEQRRQIENQAVFRTYNESVQKGIDELNELARIEGHYEVIHESDKPLYFFCECSDENCRKRIKLRPSKYGRLHENRQHFVIIDGHEVTDIERVVDRAADYIIVEKIHRPSENPGQLEPTGISNV